MESISSVQGKTDIRSYGMIDCVIGGQLLSAVADNDMSIIVGVIIVAVS